MGSQSKRKKATQDSRNVISDLKRDTDLDATRTAIDQAFEGIQFQPLLVGQTDYINVTETFGASQTNGPTPPTQVIGLNVVAPVGSNTQLNLTWTANGSPGVTSYNIYRGVVTGGEVLVNTSTTNSFSDTNLLQATTYFYKVAAVNDFGMVGTQSVEDSATTTGVFQPGLELHFNNDYNDTSPYTHATFTFGATPVNGFTPSGQFGSAWLVNTPITPPGSPGGYKDTIFCEDHSALQMNTSVGFTISVWVYPVDLTAAPGFRRYIISKSDDAVANLNDYSLTLDSAGILYFFVKKAGTTYKRQVSGFVTGSWQHIGAVFNGATNTVEVYRNGVAGVASVAAVSSGEVYSSQQVIIGFGNGSPTVIASTYYEGRLDELRYYQKVLTLAQINNLRLTNAL